ncbi:D-arabinono-1,4-lactone oxidase [uncultured Amnibacterium sp.]|uniref:D-arabinono-1,4-lactone oxidase n=1 Tax=uncultured Amnibacterium sp. TaxID=1631851 RepID=UPI0035CAB15B
MQNWGGNVTFTAPALIDATSVAQVRRAVASGGRVRAIGTRHSFNELADTDGTLVSVLDMPPDFHLDEHAGTVSFAAGTRYGAVAAYLVQHGLALHNTGSLPHISVAGAIATGTHGSGVDLGNLATAVRALELVGPGGDLRRIAAGDGDFAGSVVALGSLGVVTRVTLAVQPSYLIRQDVYEHLPWPVLLADVDAVVGAAYSVSVFLDWRGDTVRQVWLKRRVSSEDEPVADDLLGAARNPSATASIISPIDNTTPLGVARPWAFTLPHFRLDATPSAGDEIQSEYFVPREHAADALRAVREQAPVFAPHLLISELRTVAADDLWLSPANGRDSLAIHFTWRNDTPAVLDVLPAIEAALAPFAPRPHWAKVHTMAPQAVLETYPDLPRMRDLITRADPQGVFRNEHLDRALGLQREFA